MVNNGIVIPPEVWRNMEEDRIKRALKNGSPTKDWWDVVRPRLEARAARDLFIKTNGRKKDEPSGKEIPATLSKDRGRDV